MRSLKSGSNILIAENTVLNLTPLLDDKQWWRSNGSRYQWVYSYQSANLATGDIASEKVDDGRQLTVEGLQNVNITGEGNSQIVVEARYAFCLNFVNCEDITLHNLTIGHTQGGHCEGGVVGVTGGKNIHISDCNLYGCGTYGVQLRKTAGFEMYDTDIHDCTYGIMTLVDVASARFDRCDFYRNRQYDLVESRNSNMAFNDCRFFANHDRSTLFAIDGECSITGCTILHPDGYRGNIDDAELSGNWYFSDADDPYFKDGSAGPARVKVAAKGAEPDITDFINAYMTVEGDADNTWKEAWKSYVKTGKAGAGATCVIDDDKSRVHLEWKTDRGTRFHDFCVWDCFEGGRKLFGHSYGTFADSIADLSQPFGVMFYNYNTDAKTLSYLARDGQLLPAHYVDGDGCVYLFSTEGFAVLGISQEGERWPYLWNGDIFMKGEAFGY